MNYKKIHDQIIERAQLENRRKRQGYYYDLHHIIPRCMNGSNDEENKVLLTAREHFIIHKLLVEIYPDNKKLKRGIIGLINFIIGDIKNSRNYEKSKMLYSESHSLFMKGRFVGELNPMYGKKFKNIKPRSEKSRERYLEANTGENNPMFNYKYSEEQLAIKSEMMSGDKNPFFNKSHSIESLSKMRESHQNRERVICPHCCKELDISNATRWHFDNCKHKPKE